MVAARRAFHLQTQYVGPEAEREPGEDVADHAMIILNDPPALAEVFGTGQAPCFSTRSYSNALHGRTLGALFPPPPKPPGNPYCLSQGVMANDHEGGHERRSVTAGEGELYAPRCLSRG